MPGASALNTITKLGSTNAQEWKSVLRGYLGACGLGHYIKHHVNASTEPAHVALHEMYRSQAIFAIRTSIDAANAAHISGIEDPREAFNALEKGHGMSSGLATANIITQIITARPEDSDAFHY